MAYYLKNSESLKESFVRMGEEEVDKALLFMEKKKQAVAIHKVRTTCKKVRALARLYRDALDKEQYQLFNSHFRDLAGQLSAMRDVKTALDALNGVLEDWKKRDGSFPFPTWRIG